MRSVRLQHEAPGARGPTCFVLTQFVVCPRDAELSEDLKCIVVVCVGFGLLGGLFGFLEFDYPAVLWGVGGWHGEIIGLPGTIVVCTALTLKSGDMECCSTWTKEQIDMS